MNDAERAKYFVMSWARYTLALGSAEQAALNELKSDGAAHQQVTLLYRDELSTDAKRKQVAFHLALADFHELVSAA